MALLIKLTNAELQFVLETLDGSREELEELVKTEDWYVTEMDERCLTAYNIMKYAQRCEAPEEKQEVSDIEAPE